MQFAPKNSKKSAARRKKKDETPPIRKNEGLEHPDPAVALGRKIINSANVRGGPGDEVAKTVDKGAGDLSGVLSDMFPGATKADGSAWEVGDQWSSYFGQYTVISLKEDGTPNWDFRAYHIQDEAEVLGKRKRKHVGSATFVKFGDEFWWGDQKYSDLTTIEKMLLESGGWDYYENSPDSETLKNFFASIGVDVSEDNRSIAHKLDVRAKLWLQKQKHLATKEATEPLKKAMRLRVALGSEALGLASGTRLVQHGGKVRNVIPEGKAANHIFSGKPGKLKDTPRNRKQISKLVNNSKNYIGLDPYGKAWYARTRRDGSQLYGYTQKGLVKGAGVNNPARNIAKNEGIKK